MRWIKKGLSVCIFFLSVFALCFIIRFWISPASKSLKGIMKQMIETEKEPNCQDEMWELAKQKNQQWITISDNSIVSENTVIQKMPLEMFLAKCLAASMDASYDLEALKAQAIVIRTNLMRKEYESNGNINESEIYVLRDEIPYRDFGDMKQKWGKSYNEYSEKILNAVIETSGIIMEKDERPIAAPYHQMSAGRTRDAVKGLGLKYASVKSVSCDDNLSAEHFLQIIYLSQSKFEEPLSVERDDAGYITSVSFKDRKESGESFRSKYQLASANIEWKQTKDGFMICSKGIGHGFGFDEYYGNCLAKQGMDAFSILSYFFDSISFEKINGIA